MLNHITMIHWIFETMCKNVEEAERYAKKAHAMRTKHRQAADWCADMAKKHMEFNEKPMTMLDQTVREIELAGAGSDMMAAIRATVSEKKGRIHEETAEVKTMIEIYDRQ